MRTRPSLLAFSALLLAGCSGNNQSSNNGLPPSDPASGQTLIQPLDTDPNAKTANAARTQAEAFASKVNFQTAKGTLPALPPADATSAKPPKTVDIQIPDLQLPEPSISLGPKQDPAPPAPAHTRDPVIANVGSAPSHAAAVASPSADPLEIRINRQAADFPRDLSAQLDRQILLMLQGQVVPDMAQVSTLPKEDRELLAATLDALTGFRTTARNDANLLTIQKARPLIELADRLRAGAELRIPSLALCSRVDGFGVYQPIAADRFLAGREYPVVLYCEVENFLSRQAGAGQWETNLSQEITLYNDRGQRIWTEKSKDVKDLCRNRRHDFFVGQRLVIPSSLNPGQYSLRVTIVDQNANRVAENTLPIRVVADR